LIKTIKRIYQGVTLMLRKATFFGTLAGFGFLLGAISGVIAAPAEHNMAPQSASTQFRRIDQPLGNKVAVTLGGLGLIGLELWWFLLSKPKSQQAQAQGGIQEVTVTVDGGYEPSRIVVQVGQPVRLNFLRRDPSSCLEEVRLPDFHIAQNLTLNKITAVEFTPTAPGSYEFACGMNMFRGVIEVKPSSVVADLENPSAPVPTLAKQEYSA
jgi:plastocyanin domain-containing protein